MAPIPKSLPALHLPQSFPHLLSSLIPQQSSTSSPSSSPSTSSSSSDDPHTPDSEQQASSSSSTSLPPPPPRDAKTPEISLSLAAPDASLFQTRSESTPFVLLPRADLSDTDVRIIIAVTLSVGITALIAATCSFIYFYRPKFRRSRSRSRGRGRRRGRRPGFLGSLVGLGFWGGEGGDPRKRSGSSGGGSGGAARPEIIDVSPARTGG